MTVSWLHKIGVDVCRLRREDIKVAYHETQASELSETHSPTQPTEPKRSRTTPEKKVPKDDLFSQTKGLVRKVSTRHPKNQSTDSKFNVKKSFQICVYTSSEFAILYDHTLSLKNELIQDLAQALHLRSTNNLNALQGKTSIFQWPPPESNPTHAQNTNYDIKSAARALIAFLTENARQLQSLLILGELANSVVVDKVENDLEIYRVLEIHSNSGWKRALWTELNR